MNKKYAYILSNTERSDLVKIGKTNNSPRNRARTLSNETGAIGHFVVEWFMEVPDNDLAEKILFYKFRENHYDKEFFKIDLQDVISTALIELCIFFEIKESGFYIKNKEILEKRARLLTAKIKALQAGDRIAKLANEDKTDTNDKIALKMERNLNILSECLNSKNQIIDY